MAHKGLFSSSATGMNFAESSRAEVWGWQGECRCSSSAPCSICCRFCLGPMDPTGGRTTAWIQWMSCFGKADKRHVCTQCPETYIYIYIYESKGFLILITVCWTLKNGHPGLRVQCCFSFFSESFWLSVAIFLPITSWLFSTCKCPANADTVEVTGLKVLL